STIGTAAGEVNAEGAGAPRRPSELAGSPHRAALREIGSRRCLPAAAEMPVAMAYPLLTRRGLRSPPRMRSMSRSLAFSFVPRGERPTAPLEAFSRTEKIIAFCRVLLAVATLAVVIVDPKQPSLGDDLAFAVLYGYVAYSGILFLLVRGEYLRQEWVGRY